MENITSTINSHSSLSSYTISSSLRYLVAGLLVSTYYTFKLFSNFRKLPLPPGPKGWPIIGNLLEFPKKRRSEIFSKWGNVSGMFEMVSLGLNWWIRLMDIDVWYDSSSHGQTRCLTDSCCRRHCLSERIRKADANPELSKISRGPPRQEKRHLQRQGCFHLCRWTVRPRFNHVLFFRYWWLTFDDRVGWNKALGLTSYGQQHREMRKHIHTVIGAKNGEQFFELEEIETKRFLRKLRDSPDKFIDHCRWYFLDSVLSNFFQYQL